MKNCNLKCVSKYGDQIYLAFRGLIGAMFFLHGVSKFSAEFSITSLLGVAGVVEVLVGLLLVLGLWTRLAALGGAITMVVAYVMMHPGFNPLVSGGELALLYLLSFLIMIRDGAGKYSLEKKLFKKEQF